MGEVWRARDPRLSREVAVKLLPAAVRDDPVRLRRFELEARATGSLSHPNVLAVHDFGVHEGTPYLVSELLEGETLRTRLRRGPVPPRKAVEIAAQVARGLAAAHAKGIAHRDLKPDNLFLCADGRVKILDFGLAKQTNDATTGTGTLSDDGTGSAAVLGSVGYMAPEQVRGQPADARADVFALGAVLHEMVSGARAFEAPSPVEVGWATLHRDPPELAGASPGVQRVVRRCLEKAPAERFQSAGDLAFALEALVAESSTSGAGLAATPARRSAGVAWMALAGVLVLVSAIALVFPRAEQAGHAKRRQTTTRERGDAPAGNAPPPVRATRVAFGLGSIAEARFSATGRNVVFAAALEGQPWQTYVATPGRPEVRAVSAPWECLSALSRQDEMALAVAPVPGRGGDEWSVARASLAGGGSRIVATNATGADWAPDGQLLVARNREGRATLELDGRALYSAPGAIGSPRFSPDGSAVAFAAWPVAGDDRGTVELVDRHGTHRRLGRLWYTLHGLAWSPDGSEVWFTGGMSIDDVALRAVALDGRERVVYQGLGDLILLDVATDGRVLLTATDARFRVEGTVQGGSSRSYTWFDGTLPVDVTPDGRLLLATEGVAASGSELQTYLVPTDGAPAVHLSQGRAHALSPDGTTAIVATTAPFTTLSAVPTGAGATRALPSGDFAEIGRVRFFPDGRRILLVARRQDQPWRLWIQELGGGPPRVVGDEALTSAVTCAFQERATAPSPDGRWTATIALDRRPVLVALDTGETRPLAGLEVGDIPLGFTADGRRLYVSPSPAERPELPTEILQYDIARRRRTPWRSVAPTERAGVFARSMHGILVSPDGRTLLYTYQRRIDRLYVVEGLR